jgi:hypothetical protein
LRSEALLWILRLGFRLRFTHEDRREEGSSLLSVE